MNETIQTEKWHFNSGIFLFSLESKKRKKEMMKFEKQSNKCGGFKLKGKEFDGLFLFGSSYEEDISIYKNNINHLSSCQQTICFDYHGIENALRQTKSPFIPKRILLIQMI